MSMLPDGACDPPTRDDLRRLEARVDARLQEINARIVLRDGRFAAVSDRINQTDRRTDALSGRIDSRLRSIDRRFDGIEIRLDQQDARLQELVDQLIDVERTLTAPWWSFRRSGLLPAAVLLLGLLIAGLAGLPLT